MGSLLVHITHGLEAPSRVALAFLVAKSAVEAGHEVTVFLAADAVVLMKDDVIASLSGVGLGALSDHLPPLVEAGVPIYVSRLSANARGVTEDDLSGKGARFAAPTDLVGLTFAHDRVLTY
jgi:predicted peroxiredoxin